MSFFFQSCDLFFQHFFMQLHFFLLLISQMSNNELKMFNCRCSCDVNESVCVHACARVYACVCMCACACV